MTCAHGMPSPASCVDCMIDGPVGDTRAWRQVGAPFSASFEGFCPTCGGHIEPGQQIRRFDHGDARTAYVHGRCAAPPSEVR